MKTLVSADGRVVVGVDTPLTPAGYGRTVFWVAGPGPMGRHPSEIRWIESEASKSGIPIQGDAAEHLIKQFDIAPL